MQTVRRDTRLGEILRWCEQHNASDLHVQTAKPLVIRIDGELQRVDEKTFPPFNEEKIHEALAENFPPEICQDIRTRPEMDLSFYHGRQRYRANFSKEKGSQSFSF